MDTLNYIIAIFSIGVLGIFGFVGYEAILTLRKIRHVITYTENIAEDIDHLRLGLKKGMFGASSVFLSLVSSLLRKRA